MCFYWCLFTVKSRVWLLLLSLGVAPFAWGNSVQPNAEYDSRLVLSHFNSDQPGRGVDSYDHQVLDHAMGYALYAAAQVLNKDYRKAEVALEWLATNSNEGIGWGLPFEWDAFSDGSVNSRNTVYGITVAWGVKALLDFTEGTGSDKYVWLIESVLDYYMGSFSVTPAGGYFWYSDSGSDDKNVHNVSAMLAGQYARAGKLLNKKAYVELSALAFRGVWGARHDDGKGMHWRYSDFSNRPNDSVHAAYVVYGLSVYSQAVGEKLDLERACEYLLGFVSNGVASEYSHLESLSPSLLSRRARSWGVGMMIFVLSDQGRLNDADRFIKVLPDYDYGGGVFGLNVGEKVFFPRVQGHIALGIARRERSVLGF